MRTDQSFFCLDLKDYPKLAPLAELTRCIATLPPGLDPDSFARENQGEGDYALRRAGCYRVPDRAAMLREEARSALDRATQPEADAATKASTFRTWTKCFGHYAFTDRSRIRQVQQVVDSVFNQHCSNVGDFLYPPFGFRGWHTNKFDAGGWALYLIQVDRPNESFFRYIDPVTEEVVTNWDRPDTFNIFQIQREPLFWHCICSERALRWSQGFCIPGNWRDLL